MKWEKNCEFLQWNESGCFMCVLRESNTSPSARNIIFLITSILYFKNSLLKVILLEVNIECSVINGIPMSPPPGLGDDGSNGRTREKLLE